VGTPVISMTTTFATVGADRTQQLLGGPCRARWAVKHADDRQDQELLAHLQQRGVDSSRMASCCWRMMRSRSCTKTDAHGVGDAVGGGLVGVEHPVQQVEVGLVLLEQRPREPRRAASSTMPRTSSVSTPRGMMRSDRFTAHRACSASTLPVSSTST